MFYISEKVNEHSYQIPEKHPKLKDDPDRLKFTKRKMKLNYSRHYNVEKPCIKLEYCPYGSFAQSYITEEAKEPYKCKLYGNKCPVFYFGFGAKDRR